MKGTIKRLNAIGAYLKGVRGEKDGELVYEVGFKDGSVKMMTKSFIENIFLKGVENE